MSLIGVFTDIGIEKAREAQDGEGFRIFPESFSVSSEETAGFPDVNSLKALTAANASVFFNGPVASAVPIDTNIKQAITFSAVPDAGDFTLRFESETTNAIPFNATASQIETELEALTNIIDATVTGDFTSGFEISFTGVTLSAPSNTLEASGSSVVITITTNEVKSNAVRVSLEIPPGQLPGAAEQVEDIKEVYVFAKDINDDDFLLAVGRPTTTQLYDNQGQTTLRLTLRLLNSDFTSLLVFQFTQSTEISTHNQDPNAHPDIRANLEKAGIFEQAGEHEFIGQHYDEFATGPDRSFEAGVLTQELVYLDTDGVYKKALADGTIKQRVAGMADLDRGQVYTNGIVKIQTGLPPSTLLYLHPVNPGQFTDVPSGKPIGQTLDEFNVILRVEEQSQVSEYVDTVASSVPGFNHYPTIQEAIDAAPVGGWVRVDELEALRGPDPIRPGKQVNLLFTGISSGVQKFNGLNEIQTITFSATPDAGDFVLVHDGNETSRIPFTANAGDIETALEALPSISDVIVTGDFSSGFTIEFVGVDGLQDQLQVAPGTDPGVNEVQRLNFDNNDFDSGSFELEFDGQTTNAIAFNQVNAPTIEAELEALSNITSVSVTQEPSPPAGQTEFVIEFTGVDGKQNQNAITVVNNSLQDSGSTAIVGTISTDVEGELPDNLLTASGSPVTAIGNTTQEGEVPGVDKAFELDADGVQFIGLGQITGFDTAIDLNLRSTTRIEMFFDGNTTAINSTGVPSSDFNTEGSIGFNPSQAALEDTSFRDLVKVVADSPTPSKEVDVTSAEVTLSDGSKHGFIVDQTVSNYPGGTINFETGVVSGPGTDFTPYTASSPNNFFKYVVVLNSADEIVVILPSGDSPNANTAPIPKIEDGILRAIVTVQDDGAGGINDILPGDIKRFFDVGAFADEFKQREFNVPGGGSSVFDVSSGGSGDNFTFDPDNSVLDIEVFVNGIRQIQDRTGGLNEDYRKISSTEIEFSDGQGNPFTIPSGRVTVRFKDNKIDRLTTGIVQASFAEAERDADGVTSDFTVTPEITNMNALDSVRDVVVYVNGIRQTVGKDYIKLSSTQIRFVDNDGTTPFAPPSGNILIQSRDFAVGSGSSGNTIEAKDEGVTVSSPIGSLDFVGPFLEATEVTPGNVRVESLAEVNDALNVGGAPGEVYTGLKGPNGELRLRTIKGIGGISVTLDGDTICVGLATSPYFFDAKDDSVGLTIGLPSGRFYDPGTNKLSVFKNGQKLVQSLSAGGLEDRYVERTPETIELFSSATLGDVFSYVNEDITPAYRTIITGVTGTALTVPTYTPGNKRLRVWRNGVLMTPTGAGTAVDRYTETDPNTVTLDLAADSQDFFIIENMGEDPDFREDRTSEVGNTITLANNYVPGDDKLLVFRNGLLMVNADKYPAFGNPVDRYTEISTTEVQFEQNVDTDDVIIFIRKP